MKATVIFDSAGNLIGLAHSMQPLGKGKKEGPQIEAGVVAQPGQTVCEVDVPEELLRLEGPNLLEKLVDVDAVKKAVSTLVTAGQGR